MFGFQNEVPQIAFVYLWRTVCFLSEGGVQCTKLLEALISVDNNGLEDLFLWLERQSAPARNQLKTTLGEF